MMMLQLVVVQSVDKILVEQESEPQDRTGSLHTDDPLIHSGINTTATSDQVTSQRHLQSNSPYFQRNDFGERNYDISLGNPMRGLATDPLIWDITATGVATSLEVAYLGWGQVVKSATTYDWTDLEFYLNLAAARKNHFVPRFFIVYAGYPPSWPADLAAVCETRPYGVFGGGISPYFGDPILMQAMKDFIYAFGAKYDGDSRLAFVQTGLLGFWGEWHDMGLGLISDIAPNSVLRWYKDAFKITPVQTRYPGPLQYDLGIGYHDDSFTFYTLDGEYNGWNWINWYFYPLLQAFGADFWKRAPMGGELRPESTRIVFEDSYPKNTYERQDFYACSQMTRATYMKAWDLFTDFGMARSEVDRANWNSARMGYSYQINLVTAMKSMTNPSLIDIDVVVENNGIAPFYYPLALALNCSGIGSLRTQPGVEQIIDQFSNKTFSFKDIPATQECLNAVSFTFNSTRLHVERPIKFAQGTTGFQTIQIPLPPSDGPVPLPVPVPLPATTVPVTAVPVSEAPVTAPVEPPVVPSMSFAIVDIATLKEYDLTEGATIDLLDVGHSITLQAKIDPPAGSRVEFDWLDGSWQKWSESAAPYFMAGNVGTTYYNVGYLSIIGAKSVTVTAISSTGQVVTSQTIKFNVIDSTADLDFNFILVDPNTNEDITSVQSGTVIDLGKVGDELSLRAEL
jgi:hypothetical protein